MKTWRLRSHFSARRPPETTCARSRIEHNQAVGHLASTTGWPRGLLGVFGGLSEDLYYIYSFNPRAQVLPQLLEPWLSAWPQKSVATGRKRGPDSDPSVILLSPVCYSAEMHPEVGQDVHFQAPKHPQTSENSYKIHVKSFKVTHSEAEWTSPAGPRVAQLHSSGAGGQKWATTAL